MKYDIEIKPIVSTDEIQRYWREQDAMHTRDVFPDANPPIEPEMLDFLLSDKYRSSINAICERSQNRAIRVFFILDGNEVGFALYCTYQSEDAKCFVISFCIYPQYRCQGFGARCFQALKERAVSEGAQYFELNTHCARSVNFWSRQGFIFNGFDDGGSILLCLPPADLGEIAISKLCAADLNEHGWQLRKLMNGFLHEIGESIMTDERMNRINAAIAAREIHFFAAWRGYRMAGMCSVASCFSTFACSTVGLYDDFFVEPIFRKRGIARALAKAAQNYCAAEGIASLTVCCSPSDEEMYRALGFDVRLGTTYACLSGK